VDREDTHLLLNDLTIDLASRDIVVARQGNIQVTFIVSQVQIDLSAVVQNIDLT
jgi:hypothetical protein